MLRSYKEILDRLNTSIKWLDEIEVRVQNTRFESMRRDLHDLINVVEGKKLGRFENEDDYVSGLYSLIEANDFIDIHDVYKKKVGNKLIQTLKIAVKGVKPGVRESTTNNKARNALAELSWGALLEKSNYNTSHEFDPDIIQFLDDGKSIIWEVKRPISNKQILKRLKEGTYQIKSGLKNELNIGDANPIGGCVVIFVENILGSERAIVVGADNLEMDKKVKNELSEWWEQNKPNTNLYWKQGLLGVVLWWRLIGTNLFTSNTHFIDWHQRLFQNFHTNTNSAEMQQIRSIIDSISRNNMNATEHPPHRT